MKRIIPLLVLVGLSSVEARMLFVPQEYPSIQAGIDSSQTGDTVMVQLGTYHENPILHGHNITLASTYLTTLDSSRIIGTTIYGGLGWPVLTVENGEDSSCVIAGFTITHGSSAHGGGIRCSNSNPTIISNIITNCGSNITYGGGIYCDSSNPLIRKNNIYGNKAAEGGGIYCTHADARILDNTIRYDTATANNGGGIYSINSDAVIAENRIFHNIAVNGAAIFCNNHNVRIYNNDIEYNNASSDGGGIYTGGSSHQIYGNRVIANSAQQGGGIKSSANAVISNNIIAQNAALGTNTGSGGGVYIEGNPLLYNNTIYGNSGNYGGAVWVRSSKTQIWNSIIWGNSSTHGGQIYVYQGIPPTVLYCDIQEGWAGPGNININPEIRNPAGPDYHLKSLACGDELNSPCIDVGIPHIQDSSLTCSWGLGLISSDMGAYGGGSVLEHQPQIINVPDDYSLIQSAIDVSFDGDTILVQPGIYVENLDFHWHAPILGSLYMTTGDTSYILSTVIDGSNSNSVIKIIRADSGSAVIGLTLRNGNGTNGGGIYSQGSSCLFEHNLITQNSTPRSGAGIFCTAGYYIIRNNTISNNSAAQSGGAIYCQSHAEILYNYFINNTGGFYGGALFNSDYEAFISANYFETNTGRLGGAICCQANPTISENIFFQNHATERGGGIFCWAGASPIIDGNQFVSNDAELDGGGVYLTNGANATVSGNNFESNSCYYGAAIYCSADAEITGNRISDNSGPFGAGIYCVASSPLIAGNQFSWNFASMRGAGIYCYDNAAPIIMHNRIFENNGQGIYCYESNPMIVNNVIVQNVAEFGAGLYTWDSHPFVANSIFWSNQSDQGPDIVAEGDNLPEIIYCDIQQGWQGDGNISLSPLFRDIANHDYHLSTIACGQTQDSPCIDTGWPDLPDSLLDCDHGLGMIRSDMGAYGGDLWMVDIENDTAELPEQFLLEQNYPNPFNAQTVIAYYLSSPSNVRITIYDILGRVLKRLVDRFETAGRHQVIWDAAGMSSGIYLYRIEVSDKSETKKMVLMK